MNLVVGKPKQTHSSRHVMTMQSKTVASFPFESVVADHLKQCLRDETPRMGNQSGPYTWRILQYGLEKDRNPLVEGDGLCHDAPIMTAHKIGGRIWTRRKLRVLDFPRRASTEWLLSYSLFLSSRKKDAIHRSTL
jgi:hypothetical protein